MPDFHLAHFQFRQLFRKLTPHIFHKYIFGSVMSRVNDTYPLCHRVNGSVVIHVSGYIDLCLFSMTSFMRLLPEPVQTAARSTSVSRLP